MQLRFWGLKQQSRLSYLPTLHERLKKGLRLVHEIIKSLMRLNDKTRKERVQRLARSTLASSIFQWKLGLGPESVFPHRHITAFSTDQGSSHPSAQSKPQPVGETQRHRSSPGSVVWVSFCKVLLISLAL